MTFTKYIKDKIYYILTFSIYIILISIYLKAMETVEVFMPLARKLNNAKLIDELNDLAVKYCV